MTEDRMPHARRRTPLAARRAPHAFHRHFLNAILCNFFLN